MIDGGGVTVGGSPRARHDVGIERLEWRRVLLVPLVIALAVAAALGTAGVLRRGPLAELGWVDRQLTASAVSATKPVAESVSLQVAVAWPSDARCPAQLTVDVVETRTAVVIGPVRGQIPRIGTVCPNVVDGNAFVPAQLGAPIGRRQILRASDNATLPVLP